MILKSTYLSLLITFLLLSGQVFSQETNSDTIVTEHLGHKIYHPYTWLEDPSSVKTQEWLENQRELLLDKFDKSAFNKFNHKLQYGAGNNKKDTDRYIAKLEFFGYRTSKMTLEKKSEGYPHTLFKCDEFKIDEYDFPTVADYWVSDRYHILVAAISHSGRDWMEYVIYDLHSLDHINTLEGIIRPWVHIHGEGFYYEQWDRPDNGVESLRKNQRISFHTFHSKQSEDRVIFQNQDKDSKRWFNFIDPKKSKYLFVFHPFKAGDKWYEAVSRIDLENKHFIPQPFALYDSPLQLTFDFVHESNDSVYFRTDMANQSFEVLRFNMNEINKFDKFIPGYQEVLRDVTYLKGGYFGLKYLKNGAYFGLIVDDKGESKLTIHVVPGASLSFVSGESENESYFYIEKFCNYPQRYRINMKQMFYKADRVYPVANEEFSVVSTEIPSQDGTVKIPVLIIGPKKLKTNGDNPTMIYVYGGYGVVLEPSFSWERYYFVKNGGVLVIPGVRGSGLLGTRWEYAGKGANKDNTISDILSTAEYLIEEKYTNPQSLFLQGGSHGGFAVASAAIQKPELFRGVITNAGVHDLVRFTGQTIGHEQGNRTEFGDPDDPEAFATRLKLSPIHNLKKGVHYPSFLICTGSNDTRVAPSNSYRLKAMIDEYSTNTLNHLYVTTGGHSVASQPSEQLEFYSLKLNFLFEHTGIRFWND